MNKTLFCHILPSLMFSVGGLCSCVCDSGTVVRLYLYPTSSSFHLSRQFCFSYSSTFCLSWCSPSFLPLARNADSASVVPTAPHQPPNFCFPAPTPCCCYQKSPLPLFPAPLCGPRALCLLLCRGLIYVCIWPQRAQRGTRLIGPV